MQRKRRSGRIAKELAIVLLGTDATGKVFSEETITVVLSRHGAGVVTRYRFSPDERLTLRLLSPAKEAEIRLVGQIGGEPGRYVYGVTFVDPNPDFWPMEFPPPDPFEPTSPRIALECSMCQARQDVEHGLIEEDVYSVNGNILRYCTECGTSTPWKKATGQAIPAPPIAPAKPPSDLPLLPLAPRASKPSSIGASMHSSAESFEIVLPTSGGLSSTPPPSSYSASSAVSEFASLSEIQISPVTTSAIAVLPAPVPFAAPPPTKVARPAAKLQDLSARELDANGKRVNKRQHVRITVSFSACVRHAAHADEVVECENVSKGGVCFHSLQQYALDSMIEIAAPFSPGETALFVPAKIRRIETLSGGLVFRYGVEYTRPSSSQPYSQFS